MAQQTLDHTDVCVSQEQIRRERMAKRLRTDLLLNTGSPHSIADGLVDGTGIQMVAADDSWARVG